MTALSRKSWDAYFIDIAHLVASRSTCDRKHVGCVLTIERRIIATGYNGSLPDALHCDSAGHDMQDGHCVRTVHAEINAIAQAARAGVSTRGAVAYTNTLPCWPCFKALVMAGVTSIAYDDTYRPDPRVEAAATAAGVLVVGPELWKR